jgi:hypothetical protein
VTLRARGIVTRAFALLVPALLGAQSTARAQSQPPTDGQVKLSGSLRVRYEAIEGQPRAGFNASDELLNVRTTLAAVWAPDDWRIGAEVYDSRAYLAKRGTPLTTGEVNAFELVQAYVGRNLRVGARGKVSLQAGRFLVNLGSRRLVAADDYRNTISSYSGLRGDFASGDGWSATAIYTLPQARLPDGFDALRRNAVQVDRESFDLVLWGGLIAKARAIGEATIEASGFHLGERDAPGRPTRDRSLDALGARIVREPKAGSFDHEVEGFVQRGRISASTAANAASQEVAATFLHAEVGYSWGGGWKPRVSIEYDRASGDGPGGRYGRFDTLFGMRRGELAPAGLYNAIGRANLSSPAVRVEITPNKRSDAFVSFRPLWLAERTDAFSTTGVRDAGGRAGSYAGKQVDARARYWAIPNRLRLEVNGVLLRKGRFLREAPNAAFPSDARYLSINATASF